MANEIFNAQAAKTAIQNASAEISELVSNFKRASEHVEENFGANVADAAAMGGHLGDVASQSFSADVGEGFNNLKVATDNFIEQKLDVIIANSQAAEEEAISTYSNL